MNKHKKNLFIIFLIIIIILIIIGINNYFEYNSLNNDKKIQENNIDKIKLLIKEHINYDSCDYISNSDKGYYFKAKKDDYNYDIFYKDGVFDITDNSITVENSG